MEFNGISNEIQSVDFLGEIHKIASKLLLTFWGGVNNTILALICYYAKPFIMFNMLTLLLILLMIYTRW